MSFDRLPPEIVAIIALCDLDCWAVLVRVFRFLSNQYYKNRVRELYVFEECKLAGFDVVVKVRGKERSVDNKPTRRRSYFRGKNPNATPNYDDPSMPDVNWEHLSGACSLPAEIDVICADRIIQTKPRRFRRVNAAKSATMFLLYREKFIPRSGRDLTWSKSWRWGENKFWREYLQFDYSPNYQQRMTISDTRNGYCCAICEISDGVLVCEYRAHGCRFKLHVSL